MNIFCHHKQTQHCGKLVAFIGVQVSNDVLSIHVGGILPIRYLWARQRIDRFCYYEYHADVFPDYC